MNYYLPLNFPQFFPKIVIQQSAVHSQVAALTEDSGGVELFVGAAVTSCSEFSETSRDGWGQFILLSFVHTCISNSS